MTPPPPAPDCTAPGLSHSSDDESPDVESHLSACAERTCLARSALALAGEMLDMARQNAAEAAVQGLPSLARELAPYLKSAEHARQRIRTIRQDMTSLAAELRRLESARVGAGDL